MLVETRYEAWYRIYQDDVRIGREFRIENKNNCNLNHPVSFTFINRVGENENV